MNFNWLSSQICRSCRLGDSFVLRRAVKHVWLGLAWLLGPYEDDLWRRAAVEVDAGYFGYLWINFESWKFYCLPATWGGDYGTADSKKQSPSAISAKAFENSLTNSHQVELRVSLLGRELYNFLGQLFYHPFVLQSREQPLSAPILYKIQPSDFGLYMYNPN